MKFPIKSQTNLGSSFLLPAHGRAGARATINNNSPSPSEKFLAKPKNRRAKRKGGLGGMNFCPPVVPQSGTGGGKRFCNSALAPKSCEATTGQAEYQNRKIFVSLIEKNFGGVRLKRCLENFSVLLPPKAEAETLGGIVALWATIRSQSQDFVQKKFGFRPKDTANYHFLDFGWNFGQGMPRPCGARHYILRGFSKDF